jgi:hypothetical protein
MSPREPMDADPNAPWPTPPALRGFVMAARNQPIAQTRVTAEAVAAGLEHQRRRTQARRTTLLSATTALAATVIAGALLWPLLSARDSQAPAHGERAEGLAESGGEADAANRPALASAIRLRSSEPVEVRGPWSIRLASGTHELEVDRTADRALSIELPERQLELVEGHMTISFVDGGAAVRLHTGVAAWVGEQDRHTSIRVEALELESDLPEPSEASAAELARKAERLLAAGRKHETIEIYQQLVRKHPRAAPTRAAVLDLARLLRNDGRKHEARCAYRLYLERWPSSPVRGEVESQLERLGSGPACRGLTPHE